MRQVIVCVLLLSGCLGGGGPDAEPDAPGPDEDAPGAEDPDPGASWDPGEWQVSPCSVDKEEDLPIDVIIQTGSDLHKLTWRDDLEVNASLHIAGVDGQNVVITGEVHRSSQGYVAAGSWAGDAGFVSGLLLLDERLGVQAAVQVPPRDLADFAVDGGRIYATGENLTVFDLDLNLVSVVDLPLEYAGKQAHDILVSQGKIYLLDNIVMPIYLLIYDQETLGLEQRIEETGQHLKGQWYDDERQEWGVLNPMGFMGASHSQVLRYDAQGASRGETTTFSGRYSYWAEGDDSEEEGYKIEGWSQEGPLWLAFKGNGSTSVGPVFFDEGIHACAVATSSGAFGGMVARQGQVIFLLGDQLHVHRSDGAWLRTATMPFAGHVVA